MRSSAPGKSTSKAEVQDITKHGIWLYVLGNEYFMPYNNYPWFKNAKVSDIYQVKLLNDTHIYWQNLDVDLELESLITPDRYPLIYK